MSEGTSYAKIDEAIKSLNEFREETKTQIRDLNNTITRFMLVVDQRMADSSNHSQHTSDDNFSNTPTFTNNNHNNHPFRSMTIDIPHFDGSNVSSWVFKLEQFFRFYNIPEDQRLMISSFHLEGPALSWFKWMHSNGVIDSWKGFLKAINLRFGPSLYEDHRSALSKLQQTTSIAIYQTQFEDFSTKAMALARIQEDRLNDEEQDGDDEEQDAAPIEELSTEKLSTISSNNTIPEVSMPALSGHISPRTIRVKGQIINHSVNIFIDSGSTHNFIQERIVHRLGLSVVPSKQFRVHYSFIFEGPSALPPFRDLIFQIGDWVMELQVYNEPLAILNSRVGPMDGLDKKQLLIQWLGLPVEEGSWKNVVVFKEVFPHFNLADQVRFDGEWNVIAQTTVEEEATRQITTDAEAAAIAVKNGVEENSSLGRSSTQRIGKKPDPSWARIAALVPVVVSCAEAGDQIANKILEDAAQELALSVKELLKDFAWVGQVQPYLNGNGSFPVVMVGGVPEATKKWDLGKEVTDCIQKTDPGACPVISKDGRACNWGSFARLELFDEGNSRKVP
ncbi:actin-like ATPase superfamily protein [Actinidia rufa]|uniref:N-acetyl-D-glucosamine kinase n=1 Tax=Actinidia rufa TaxID=165716 RepID=A0A7J0DSR0_9ERIC|nr:actin-like ATPase superfamily protein [Actinidia rufa]